MWKTCVLCVLVVALGSACGSARQTAAPAAAAPESSGGAASGQAGETEEPARAFDIEE